ncbi:MAG: helix-turn-helix domain-containing protein [Chloroflexaceae bacterium]|jgi:excisionase family DNA binding protein|nr:helix-turn-helix domain-containing protein [Chloroflexaceae bacterium]
MLSDEQFLSLSAASKLLGVHSATLRRWADAGEVPVYITPGGHRRFARSDIEGLAARNPTPTTAIVSTWASKAITHSRSEAGHTSQRPSWVTALPEGEREEWRRIGQRLMGVVLRYVNSERDDDGLLDEARTIGMAYAQSALRVGMPLTAALEAALFFRDSLVEAAMDLPEESKVRPEASARLLRRISRVVNTVQLAVAAGYEGHA